MNRFIALLSIAIIVMFSANVNAQESGIWKKTQLADHIYKFTADGGGYDVKVIASVGDDGLLIVDSGLKEHAEALKTNLDSLGKGAPRFVILTHEHSEHINGHSIYGLDPVVLGHGDLRKTLTSGLFLFDEYGAETLPDISFSDSLTLNFNGEPIKIYSFAGAHSGTDIIVWFTKSKVACVGALSNGSHFPSVDETGDIKKYPDLSQAVIDILPDDTKIIPGHGADGTMDDFRAFHSMLVGSSELVCSAHDAGKDVAQMKSEDLLKKYASYDGSYTSKDVWIDYLIDGCEGVKEPQTTKKSMSEPLYYAIRDFGYDEAIKVYYQYKADSSDVFEIGETVSLMVGYKLYLNDKLDGAAKFFEIYTEEYPEAEYNWFAHGALGRYYANIDNLDKAVENLQKALQTKPDNEGYKVLLDSLTNKN